MNFTIYWKPLGGKLKPTLPLNIPPSAPTSWHQIVGYRKCAVGIHKSGELLSLEGFKDTFKGALSTGWYLDIQQDAVPQRLSIRAEIKIQWKRNIKEFNLIGAQDIY